MNISVLKCVALILAVAACLGVALGGAVSTGGIVTKSSCGGFKPETRTLCWRDLP